MSSNNRAGPSGVNATLALIIIGYTAIFTAAAWYKTDIQRQGFDFGVHEQVIWNTSQGRFAATSAFAGTESYLGIDIILVELLLTPFYMLLPSMKTLLFLKTLALALGAIPVALLARKHLAWAWAGPAFAAAYLLYHPVEYMNLYEFQIRAFAVPCFLWALWGLDERRGRIFWLGVIGALSCRSEFGLVLAALGMANLTRADLRQGRATLTFGIVPVVVGLGWTALCVGVLVPYFRDGAPFLYTRVIYGWLGENPTQIVGTLLTQPLWVLAQIATADRARYLLELLLPWAFLPLLRPRLLFAMLPVMALNLLSNSPNIHASTRFHYQALIIPLIIVATILVLAQLTRARPGAQRTVVIGLLALALACNLGFGNPIMRLATHPVDTARNAAVLALLAQVPPDAALTATNTIGPLAARRTQLFYFPGNVIYPAAHVPRGEYLLLDDDELGDRGRVLLAQLAASGAYTELARDAGVSLWRRAR